MKVVIIACALIAAVVAAPQLQHANAGVIRDASRNSVVLRYDNDNIGTDGYNWAVETSDGQQKEEQARLENAGTDNEAIAVQGRYSYTGVDGVLYEVVYVADRNGFRARGAHLPVSAS